MRWVLAALAPILSLLEDCTGQLITKQPNFTALPIGALQALILQDLKNLKTAIDTFYLRRALLSQYDFVSPPKTTLKCLPSPIW
ncbi:hypothetical protein B0H13DRAFT_2332653 [Mycena leptocephala]|nr:hypothetical protein B0H13DRAFT_2332653 [Mycena leptocephala]